MEKNKDANTPLNLKDLYITINDEVTYSVHVKNENEIVSNLRVKSTEDNSKRHFNYGNGWVHTIRFYIDRKSLSSFMNSPLLAWQIHLDSRKIDGFWTHFADRKKLDLQRNLIASTICLKEVFLLTDIIIEDDIHLKYWL